MNVYNKMADDIKSNHQPEGIEIIQGSIKYPGYLLLHLLGGVFICFHLILLIATIGSGIPLIRSPAGSVKLTIELIVPALVLYFLQVMINRWSQTILTFYHEQDEENLRFTTLDSILLYFNLIASRSWFFLNAGLISKEFYVLMLLGCFIGIISSIIRLIISVLVNILFMSRIEYSYLVEPLQTHGKRIHINHVRVSATVE